MTVHDTDQRPQRFDSASRESLRRLMLMGVALGVVIGVVVALVSLWWAGLLVALVAAGSWVMWVRSLVDSVLVRTVQATGARPVDAALVPSLQNALEGVAVLSGVPVPALFLLETGSANAMCAANATEAAVVVTSGLLEGARPIELEIIAAELLCRVRDGSARFATLAAGLPTGLDRMAGLSGAGVAEVLGDQRAIRADLDALALTRYPPALVAVLDRMRERGTAVDTASPRGAALWLAPAIGTEAGVDPAVDATANQPIDHRIAVLREL